MIQDIYIIDNTQNVLNILKQIFKDDVDYQFKSVTTEQLNIALKNIPDMIIIIIAQIIAQLIYPNWKWPYEVCKEFKVSYPKLVFNSFHTTFGIGVIYINKIIKRR